MPNNPVANGPELKTNYDRIRRMSPLEMANWLYGMRTLCDCCAKHCICGIPEDEVSEEVCEKCGRLMVYKTGKFGKFLACPGFPECRNTKAITKEIGIKCPKCGKEIIEKKSRRGKLFFGCSAYPVCDFNSWDRPTDKKCSKCGGLLFEKLGRGKKSYCPVCDEAATKEKK